LLLDAARDHPPPWPDPDDPAAPRAPARSGPPETPVPPPPPADPRLKKAHDFTEAELHQRPHYRPGRRRTEGTDGR